MDGWRVSYDEQGNLYLEITTNGDTYEWELSADEAEVLVGAIMEALYFSRRTVDDTPGMFLA